MSDTKLSNEVFLVDDHNWYYEDNRGLLLVHEETDEYGNVDETEQIIIPWRLLRATFERARKAGKV